MFNDRRIRTIWDDKEEKWYFSVVDVIEALTETDRPRKYWSDLKAKLKKEGSELSEKIGQLKLQSSDGKYYKTDIADQEQIFRLIQSIPSPEAEPFKIWMDTVARKGGGVAKVAREQLEQQLGRSVISDSNSSTLRISGDSPDEQ